MEGRASRGRFAFAIGAAALLATIVTVIALADGDEEDERAEVAASPRCVAAWNSDPAATAYGSHNFNFHDYEGALVTYLTTTAEEVAEGENGRCAVIFPSEALDPEASAAGQILRGRRWSPISELQGVELTRVAELQVTAAGAPNASLERSGELSAR